MKSLKKKTKILLIVAVVVVLLLFGLLVLFVPELMQAALWTLLILGLGFFGVEWHFRRKRNKKQKNFDEKVAAKEGIEDRRREWGGWIQELDRQGIDRYELPFYLLVGEPQSGKSVLLQNSDLYFPFGQERLSGVGGTRGCDWWFTDEAVILDIAGRLFTHEGGAADKLEWESFLDLLNDFRPMCPANGVLLVVPCDALLADSPEVCNDKANKIQAALLTLTQKLQAQLPVYLILTKGDRVFGFAESVHRLDGEERHQMFGWSRDAARAEKPFELDEAKAGFAMLVERARLLRERMIASARLPEALPEIDRMYAFPDELNGMYRSLEIYLKRIFTQSTLVERASFRGIYLTSGLQTGAPVARVCAELLGGNRDSDARALESLFSHQRAYFIKDLVRKRVFAERGLVRPTEGRVLAARRTAMIGYGAAAALAATAIVGSAVHLVQERQSPAHTTFASALTSARSAAIQPTIGGVLRDLHEVGTAARSNRALMEAMFQSTSEGFERLYSKICETSLAPLLRQEMEKALEQRAEKEPSSYEDFLAVLVPTTYLVDEVDFGSKDMRELAKTLLPEQWSVRVKDEKGEQVDFSVDEALKRRGGSLISKVGDRSRLDPLARRVLALLERSIDPATPWMTQGHLGFMIALMGAKDAYDYTQKNLSTLPADYVERCDVFVNSFDCIVKIKDGTALSDGHVTTAGFNADNAVLAGAFGLLTEFTTGRAAPAWGKMARIDKFARETFARYIAVDVPKLPIGTGALGRIATRIQNDVLGNLMAKMKADAEGVRQWIEDPGNELPDYRAEPRARWDLRAIEGALRSDKRGKIFTAKVRVMANQLPERFPDWARARAGYYRPGTEAPADGQLDQALVGALTGIKSDLVQLKLQDSPAVRHITKLLEEHLRTLEAQWATRTDWGEKVDWSIPMALTRLTVGDQVGPTVAEFADRLRWTYLRPHEERLQGEWRDGKDGTATTLAVMAALNEHLGKLAELETATSQKDALKAATHVEWMRKVDGDLAGRLQKHIATQRRYWEPDTSAWQTLPAALEGINLALDTSTLGAKLSEAKRIDSPAFDAPELRPGIPLTESTALPATNKAIQTLRGFRVPTESDLRANNIRIALSDVTRQVQEQLNAADNQRRDQTVAEIAKRLRALPEPTSTWTTEDYFLRPLHEVLRKRLIEEVRTRYLRALSAAVENEGPALMKALYEDTPQGINAIDDAAVIPRLNNLLKRSGRFSELRDEYSMQPKPKGGETSLRPNDDSAPDAEQNWWRFERFLGDLQEVLASSDGTVQNASFQVHYEVPKPPGVVWEFEKTDREFCYYQVDPAGMQKPGLVIYANGWPKFETPLLWEFNANATRPPTMWIVLTERFRTSPFKWPLEGADATADLWFELKGSLAPLLFAWSGVANDRSWTASFEPRNSADKGNLRLTFRRGEDKSDLVLPARPPRPKSF